MKEPGTRCSGCQVLDAVKEGRFTYDGGDALSNNQVVVSSLMRRVPAGKYRGGDMIKIKYLCAPGVRNEPNLERI